VLLLTKPIGTGIVSTAIKFARATSEAAEAAIASMLTLNRAAASVLAQWATQRDAPGSYALGSSVGGCTDITGFGLMGHGTEMARASGVTLVIEAAAVPTFPGVASLVKGNTPGGGKSNRDHFGAGVSFVAPIDEATQVLLFDPQTSGGLLVSIAAAEADAVRAALQSAGVPAWTIGHVAPAGPHAVIVR